MKEIEYEDWIEGIQELNAGQPSLKDLLNRQIEAYEKEKEGE